MHLQGNGKSNGHAAAPAPGSLLSILKPLKAFG